MRRLALALALGLLVSVPAASSRSGFDWKHLKYFSHESQHLLVATDGSWQGARLAPARYQHYPSVSGPLVSSETAVKFIWAPTCGSPAQFVSFRKTVLAPGDAVSGRLVFAMGLGRGLPFRSAAFLVNGKEIARLTARHGKLAGLAVERSEELSPTDLKAFTYGVNTLTIRADRSLLPKGQDCNTLNRLVAVVGYLDVRFGTDVVALGSQKGEKQITAATAGQTATAIGNLEFRNAGPSGSTGGKLIFRWIATGPVQTAFSETSLSAAAPFHDCQGSGGMSGTIECTYSDFPAGAVASVNVRAFAKALPEFTAGSAGSLEMDWEIRPDGGDRQGANNFARHTVMLCGAQTTDSRCKE